MECYGKAMILLDGYLKGLEVKTFSLIADTGYIVQNGSRIMWALFEICLNKNYAKLTLAALNWCKLIDKKMPSDSNPVRQFTEQSYTNWY